MADAPELPEDGAPADHARSRMAGVIAPEDNSSSSPLPAKAARAWSSVRRELSSEDLANPGVQKILVDEIEYLYRQQEQLEQFRSDAHNERIKNAGLEARLHTNVREEVLSTACLTVGSALLGFAPTAWKVQPLASILVGVAVILIGGSIITKVMK